MTPSEAVVRSYSLKKVFSFLFCQISKKTFFYRTPPVAASAPYEEFLRAAIFITCMSSRQVPLESMQFWTISGIPYLYRRIRLMSIVRLKSIDRYFISTNIKIFESWYFSFPFLKYQNEPSGNAELTWGKISIQWK